MTDMISDDEFRHAITSGHLRLVYQPQFDLQTLQIIGFEALARWAHPGRGDISPSGFVGFAEQSGFIEELDRWVLDQACRQASTWPEGIRISVNISPAHLMVEKDISDYVMATLVKHNVNPARLDLEITESIHLKETPKTIQSLEDMATEGVSFALDDFGTGYSSFGYLVHFPVNMVKIDRSFVIKSDKPHVRAIIANIIQMSRDLDLLVLAEGIETVEQLHTLRELGCNFGQGFVYSKPIEASRILAALSFKLMPVYDDFKVVMN